MDDEIAINFQLSKLTTGQPGLWAKSGEVSFADLVYCAGLPDSKAS